MTDDPITELQKKVRQIEIISNRIVTEQMAGEYHSVFKGQGMEFEEVRPYTPGDEIRTIDWNVTARAGEVHIKRYREEREMTVLIVADVSASCRFGTRGEFKSELMAEICAVLAFATIANNDRVGLLLCSDQIELFVAARKGRRHSLRLVRDVLAFRPRGVGTNLCLAMDHLRRVLHRKSVVFLISDFMELEFNRTPEFERALASMGRHHDLIAIAADDPLELELPDVGLIEVVDAETGAIRTIDTSRRGLRQRYADRQRARLESRRGLLRRNAIDLIELETGKPWAGELARFFRRRARRRRG